MKNSGTVPKVGVPYIFVNMQYVIVMPWPTRGYGIFHPDPEGKARGIRAVIFHNPEVAMA